MNARSLDTSNLSAHNWRRLKIRRNNDECVIKCKDGSSQFSAKRKGNLYKVKPKEHSNQKVSCLLFVKENHWLWHKKLGHASWRLISKLLKNNLVRDLPSMSYKMIYFVRNFKRGNKLKTLFQVKTLFPPQDL